VFIERSRNEPKRTRKIGFFKEIFEKPLLFRYTSASTKLKNIFISVKILKKYFFL